MGEESNEQSDLQAGGQNEIIGPNGERIKTDPDFLPKLDYPDPELDIQPINVPAPDEEIPPFLPVDDVHMPKNRTPEHPERTPGSN